MSQRGPKGPHLQEICREHHCHLEKQEQREREEMKQRTEGSLSPPPDIVISSFSHHIEEGGNNTQHTRLLGALPESSTVSSFSGQKKEKKKSKRREARGRRDGVKDIDSRRDKAPYPQRLYSSLLLYYFYMSAMQDVHQHGPS